MSFEIDITQRVTRVEDGVEYLKVGVDDLKKLMNAHIEQPCKVGECALKDEVEDLKHTQKWVRWLSKTAIGGSVLVVIGVIAKAIFNYGTNG